MRMWVQVLHTLWGYLWSVTVTLLLLPVYAIIHAVPALGFLRSGMSSFVAHSLLKGVMLRLRIEGQENVQPNQGYLIVANHSSIADIPLLCLVTKNRYYWVARSAMEIPIAGLYSLVPNIIRIDRSSPVRSLKSMVQQAKRIPWFSAPTNLVIFPEGRRTRDGHIHTFQKGIAMLARHVPVPILPVTLSGIYHVYPRGRFLCCFDHPVVVNIHPPVSREQIDSMKDAELVDFLEKTIISKYTP